MCKCWISGVIKMMMQNPEDRKFAEALKPGDKVLILTVGGYHVNGNLALKSIKRVTALYVVVDYGEHEKKFRKDNLEETGRKFDRASMGGPHDELIEYKEPWISKHKRQVKERKCKKIIDWIGSKNLKDLDDKTLDEYYTILIQFEREKQ